MQKEKKIKEKKIYKKNNHDPLRVNFGIKGFHFDSRSAHSKES